MRALAWGVFQLGLMFVLYDVLYAHDASIDLRQYGGTAAFACFMMSGIATWLLVELYDLFLRVRARLALVESLREHQGADNIALPRPAARAGSDLPKQFSGSRIGHDRGDII
jgi:hypothetical protein